MSANTHKVYAHQDGIEVNIRRSLLTDPLEHEPVSLFHRGLKGHQYIGEFKQDARAAHGLILRIYNDGEMVFKRTVPPSGVIANLPLKLGESYNISLK